MHPRKYRPNWPYRWTTIGLVVLLSLYIGVQTVIGGLTFARRGSMPTEWGLAFVSSLLDATVAAWFVSVGASIGSFINVVAYRLPLGRKLVGNSSCPYCETPIEGVDNVPALAWIRLRGKCRTCRLPISAQYPIVEFASAIVFFVVYASEFLFSCGNLPGVSGNSIGVGALTRISVTPILVIRIATYLFALGALMAAALIAVKNRAVPFSLYIWALIPYTIAIMVLPSAVIVRWRTAVPVGPIEARLDAFTSLLCGVATGIALARLLAPLVYQNFDRTFFASDTQTRGARQFLGAMAVTGGILGWQAVVPFGWVLLVAAICSAWFLGRYRNRFHLADLTAWVWLGLLLFRAFWDRILSVDVTPESVPDVMAYVVAAVALAGLSTVFRTVAADNSARTEADAGPDDDEDEEEWDGDPRENTDDRT
ncbi:MAG: prepilin peptidase [Planctomycetota bacterium]